MRLPYSSVFVELPLTDEVKALREPFTRSDSTIRPITRIGAYITEMRYADGGGAALTFWPCWQFGEGVEVPLEASFWMFLLNPPESLLQMGVPTAQVYVTDDVAVPATIVPSPTFTAELEKSSVPPHRYQEVVHSTLTKFPETVSEASVEISPLLFAWHTVLNARTGVDSTRVPPVNLTTLGRRRRRTEKKKTGGVTRRSAYTVISIGEVEQVGDYGHVETRKDISAHYVRGHFKQRRSGLYWWNPHIRGRGPVKERKVMKETNDE